MLRPRPVWHQASLVHHDYVAVFHRSLFCMTYLRPVFLSSSCIVLFVFCNRIISVFFSLVTLLPRNSDCKWFLNFSVCLSVEMFLRTVYVDFSMPCLLTARNSAPAEFSAQLTLSYRIWCSTHDRQIWPNICRIQGFSIQIFSFICWPCA